MASSRPSSDDSGPAKRRRPSKPAGPAKAKRAPKRAPDAAKGAPDGAAASPAGAAASPPAKRRRRDRGVVMGLVGLGLDGTDGHTRLTKGDDFVLFGGSAETHEKMQDLTIRLAERLKKKGKRIAGADMREIRDIVEELKSDL